MGQAVNDAERQKAAVLKETASLDKTGRQIDSYRKLGREILEAGQAHRAAQEKVKGLAREIAATEAPTKAQEKALAAARREVVRAAAAEEAKKQRLGSLRAELKAAGIDTRNLGDAQRKLAADMAAAKAKIEETTQAIKRQEEAMARAEKRRELGGEIRNQALKVGAAYLAIQKPLKQEGDFELQLRSFGNTAGMDGGGLEKVRAQIRGMSVDLRQSNSALLTGVETLVGKGLGAEQALASIKDIGRASTATGASIEDMSNLSYSVMANLHVPVDKLGRALDMMAQAGKEGGFELKHMAQQFPQLTSSAAKLGLTGTEAVASLGAMLQVAMKGASDPSTAANNLANFLGKITSPEAKKNFEKLGVDIEQSLKDGVAAGRNPVEVAMQEIAEATGADLNKVMADAFDENGKLVEGAADKIGESFKLGELFGDKQVQDFLAPMLANYGEYLKIKQKALGATGVVDQDFENIVNTYNKAGEKMGLATDKLMGSLGKALLPIITPLINGLADGVSLLADLADASPNATRGLLAVAAGFMAFRTVSLVSRYALTFFRGGVGGVVREMLGMARASAPAAAGAGRIGTTTGAMGGRLGIAIARLRQYSAAALGAARASNQLAGAQGGVGDLAGLGRGGGAGKLGRGLRMGGKALGGAGLLIGAGFAASDLMDPNTTKEEKGGAVGNLAGGMAGALAGAALGSVVPVVGTALGGIIGGMLGAFGGEALGGWLAKDKADEIKSDKPDEDKPDEATPDETKPGMPKSPEAPLRSSEAGGGVGGGGGGQDKAGAAVSHITIGPFNIYATPGQDVRQLADEVARLIMQRQRAALAD